MRYALLNVFRGGTRPLLLCFVALCLGALLPGEHARGEDERSGEAIQNPYWERRGWKVWRIDDSPVEGISNLVREGKLKKAVEITLAPLPVGQRIYPVDPPKPGSKKPYIAYAVSKTPSRKYAGIWDDVYSSWSGLHGYVRSRWRGPDGSNVTIKDQFMHFVDVTGDKRFVLPAGVNFVHQSTTSMGHAITNGYLKARTQSFEKIYFSDCLVTSPAHASFTEWRADQSSDLYLGHVSTLFNSLGSSNSETMAITKMIIAGGYLPPETKLLLKRNGLYPAAILYLWKAALPYTVPYAHELRHRIAYKSVGNTAAYPEKYNATALDRGITSLEFHQYDDEAHMRGMVDLARSMDVALPEAIFRVTDVEGGEEMYSLRKAAVVLQEKGQAITVSISTAGSYDLQGLPLTLRWKLLYGNKQTTIERDPEGDLEKGDGFKIHIPWDDALPEGRTAIALVANNGRFDSNPAILSIYRKKGELPGRGLTPKGYKYDLKHANHRPVLLDVQDQYVKRGKELRIPLRALDPEGFPVAFYKRAGEVGEIDGDTFVWRCPKKAPKGETHIVTIIASDETSGNSYNGRQVALHVGKPTLMAHVTADVWAGPAPLKVRFSAKGSLLPRGKTTYGWSFYQRARKRKAKPFKGQEHEREVVHTFEKPGFYEVELTVKNGDKIDTQIVGVLATRAPLPTRPGALSVEGGGVRITPADETPSSYDETDFGPLPAGSKWVEQSFRLVNTGDKRLSLRSKKSVTLSGEGAKRFKVVQRPRKKIDPRGSTWFTLRFTPKGDPTGRAVVEVHAGGKTHTFTVCAGAPN